MKLSVWEATSGFFWVDDPDYQEYAMGLLAIRDQLTKEGPEAFNDTAEIDTCRQKVGRSIVKDRGHSARRTKLAKEGPEAFIDSAEIEDKFALMAVSLGTSFRDQYRGQCLDPWRARHQDVYIDYPSEKVMYLGSQNIKNSCKILWQSGES